MDSYTSTRGSDETVEFYLPGTFQFGRGPGRIERFLRRAFGSHGGVDRSDAGAVGMEFYLPATPDVRPAKSR